MKSESPSLPGGPILGDFSILGDPAPGDVSKVCECEVLDSSAAAAEESMSMTWVPVKR